MENELIFNRHVFITQKCADWVKQCKWQLLVPTTIIYATNFIWGVDEGEKLDFLEDDFVRMNVRNCIISTPEQIERKLIKMKKYNKRTLKTN